MAVNKRSTKSKRSAPASIEATAKALNVDPKWLRTGKGSPQRRDTAPLDRNDPRVKALIADLFRETMQKADLQYAADQQQRERAAIEAAEKRKAAADAEARKPLTSAQMAEQMRSLIEPLVAIYETTDLAIDANNYDSLHTVVCNLSMLCLKRIDDCLQRNGIMRYGFADDWLSGNRTQV